MKRKKPKKGLQMKRKKPKIRKGMPAKKGKPKISKPVHLRHLTSRAKKLPAGSPAAVPSFFRADLHVHTAYSVDSVALVEDVLASAVRKGLSAIAITDHNQVQGALEAQKIARQRRLPLQVIAGEEVATDQGDLLVYFIRGKIVPGPLARVLAEVKKQGAVCAAAHPYDFARHGIRLEKLPSKLLSQIDALEAFNARVTFPKHNSSAMLFARKSGKPPLAGSDSHHPLEVGAAYTEFHGIPSLDRNSILSAPRELKGSLSPPFVHLFSRYAVVKKKLYLLRKKQRAPRRRIVK